MKLIKYKTAVGSLAVAALLICSSVAFGQAQTLGDLADNVMNSFQSIGTLMIAASYIAGFGLTVAAIFKFKQHKDNPTQIPVGTPIALLVIGIILVFLPSIFGSAGETIFSGDQEIGGFKGEGATTVGSGSGGGGS